MIDYKDVQQVKDLASNMRTVFGTPQGKEVMDFLEQACGWYESIFDPENPDRKMLNAGKREVLATIKTFLKLSPEEIALLAQRKEGQL